MALFLGFVGFMVLFYFVCFYIIFSKSVKKHEHFRKTVRAGTLVIKGASLPLKAVRAGWRWL